MLFLIGCNKGPFPPEKQPDVQYEDHLSDTAEFRNSLMRIDSLVNAYGIPAFLDTLPDGMPDCHGPVMPLTQLVKAIIAKTDHGDLASAVHDVYHFDGSTFSLISYLIKAKLGGVISHQTLIEIMGEVPLPPIEVTAFEPPSCPVPGEPVEPQVCMCDPKVKIRVSWAYRPNCGNYTREYNGYAAGNTLTNMPRGTVFRLDAEVEGCDCGGTWSHSIQAVGLTSYGYSSSGGNSVSVISESEGTLEITFTYKCGCGCGKQDSKTFKISFD